MSYSPSQLAAAAAALVAEVHGLRADVARAWAEAEQGVRYNIVGVTYIDAHGRQRLFAYSSWDEGARAAAHLIATGPYAGVRAALAGGSSRDQAAALIASPWNHPYYSRGLGAEALRAIAAVPQAAAVYRVDSPGTTINASSSSASPAVGVLRSPAIAARSKVAGVWWYRLETVHPGGWVHADGRLTATRVSP